ncbi:MAG TPA: hypothetical protein VMT14_00385, partial [Burkholderiaceae bacterium]|nr:hypothetical protein [Burkholderiaceae bacterium]
SYTFTPTPPYWAYQALNKALINPMGNTELAYEPRMSADGSRVLNEFTGQLYWNSFALLGQVPDPSSTDVHFLMTLTPDASRILVLRQTYTTSSKQVLDSQAIDVYNTSQFSGGFFAKIGSLPITTDASICNQNFDDCHYGNQYLLPSVDSKTLFWIGNQNMQVFSIP